MGEYLILDSEICLAAVRGLAQIWHSSLVVTVPFVSAEIVMSDLKLIK